MVPEKIAIENTYKKVNTGTAALLQTLVQFRILLTDIFTLTLEPDPEKAFLQINVWEYRQG